MFKSIVRRFEAWRRYGAAMNELSRLSDRDLADIGVSRFEIQRLAWHTAHARSSTDQADNRASTYSCEHLDFRSAN
jgi:uncharacterized protein YjiS (DUF1127 family)